MDWPVQISCFLLRRHCSFLYKTPKRRPDWRLMIETVLMKHDTKFDSASRLVVFYRLVVLFMALLRCPSIYIYI